MGLGKFQLTHESTCIFCIHPTLLVMSINFDLIARYNNCSFWKCELKPSEHACKIFFNYSKLCVVNFFASRIHYLPPKHTSRTSSCNMLASQDLTPMLAARVYQINLTLMLEDVLRCTLLFAIRTNFKPSRKDIHLCTCNNLTLAWWNVNAIGKRKRINFVPVIQ